MVDLDRYLHILNQWWLATLRPFKGHSVAAELRSREEKGNPPGPGSLGAHSASARRPGLVR